MNALPRKKLVLGVAGAALALVVVGWFLLVSPQRAKGTDLAVQVDAAKTDLAGRQAALLHPPAKVTVRASDGYRLSKALPTTIDMPGVILDVQRLASRNKLAFVSIQPQAGGVPGNGFVATPVALKVQGRFGDVSKFVGELRSLVRVRHDRLDTRGRLYSVASINLGSPPSPAKFPVVMADVSLTTFTFSPPPPAAAPSTTPSTTSGSQSSATVAAGATP